MLQSPDDFDKQGGRVFEFFLEVAGAEAQPLERFGSRPLAGIDKFIRPERKLLHAVRQCINGNARLFRDIGKFLESAIGQTGTLRLTADARNAFRDISNAPDDGVKSTDGKPADDATGQAFAESANGLHGVTHGLLDTGTSLFGVGLHLFEAGSGALFLALHIPLVFIESCRKGDKQLLAFICHFQNSYAAACISRSKSSSGRS
nr:hypothetical protein [Agrobacterium tumefaciens]